VRVSIPFVQEDAEIHWCDNGGFFVEVEGLPTAEEVDEYEELPVPAKVPSRIRFSTDPIKVRPVFAPLDY
jgi:hypothetical protein